MGFLEWGAISVLVTIAITLAGWLWKLATRIAGVEAKADAAGARADSVGINMAAVSMKILDVSKEVSDHKETVAKEYVSYTHMANFENRLLDAIGKLGDRIDGLFTRVAHG